MKYDAVVIGGGRSGCSAALELANNGKAVCLVTEGLTLEFKNDAITKLAEMAYNVNEQTEDIGARRLHTLLEKLLEEVSFEAPDMAKEGKTEIIIDADYVDKRLKDIAQNTDLSQFIL